MTSPTSGTRSTSGRLDDAVRRLYSACHLREPVVVTARNAVEFARVSSAVTARTGYRQSLAMLPLVLLSIMFTSAVAVVIKGFIGVDDQVSQMLGGSFAFMAMATLFSVSAMPYEPRDWRSEAPLSRPWRFAAVLLCIAVTVPLALAVVPGPVSNALVVAALASLSLAILLTGGVVFWPVWLRREIAADLGVGLPLRGAEPARGIFEQRLAFAVASVPGTMTRDSRFNHDAVERSRNVEAAAVIERESRRLALFWPDFVPVLGRVARFGSARDVALLAIAEPAGDRLPAVLTAAVEIDRMADALCVFDGVAVVLPANAPLTFPTTQWLRAPGRDEHAPVFDWLGYRGPLAAALRVLPPRLGDRLLARYVARIPDAGRRSGAIKAFGTGRFFAALKPHPVQQDRSGRLYMIGTPEDPSAFVEVEDATIAPDGTRRRYWLSVPPHIATAHEAVAATFGRTTSTYNLADKN